MVCTDLVQLCAIYTDNRIEYKNTQSTKTSLKKNTEVLKIETHSFIKYLFQVSTSEGQELARQLKVKRWKLNNQYHYSCFVINYGQDLESFLEAKEHNIIIYNNKTIFIVAEKTYAFKPKSYSILYK